MSDKLPRLVALARTTELAEAFARLRTARAGLASARDTYAACLQRMEEARRDAGEAIRALEAVADKQGPIRMLAAAYEREALSREALRKEEQALARAARHLEAAENTVAAATTALMETWEAKRTAESHCHEALVEARRERD